MTNAPKICVCSPFRGVDKHEEHRNVAFAESICRQLSKAGAVVFAPHLFFTRFLDDTVAEERTAGIQSGLALMALFDAVWFVIPEWRDDLSTGMKHELEAATKLGKPFVIIRSEAAFQAHLAACREYVRGKG